MLVGSTRMSVSQNNIRCMSMQVVSLSYQLENHSEHGFQGDGPSTSELAVPRCGDQLLFKSGS